MHTLRNFEDVMTHLANSKCRRQKIAVVCPHDSHTLEAVGLALERSLADFILIGNSNLPEIILLKDRYPDNIEIIHFDDNDEAARYAVSLVRNSEADVLMKGLINTDNLLRAVLNKEHGILEKGCVLTHITCAEINGMGRLLYFSDAAVIPSPNLEQHSAIAGYMASVCRAFGISTPRIALIHCNEKTSDKFPVTISYATIKERAQSGAYGSVIIDGPMDVKTALDSESAEIKGIKSDIGGMADGLIFPDIEAGNVFYKTISYFTHSLNAGMLVGAMAPVVLPSRSDSSRSKMCSLAMACLYSMKSSKN